MKKFSAEEVRKFIANYRYEVEFPNDAIEMLEAFAELLEAVSVVKDKAPNVWWTMSYMEKLAKAAGLE